MPDTSTRCRSASTCRTVISFLVSVPVLSEQITDVLPRVSTTGSRRTSALRFTMRRTPIAREMVTTAGSASGTTATARAMPKTSMSIAGRPRTSPTATTSVTTSSAARPSARPSRSRFCCNGVGPDSTVWTSREMRPNSVDIPVATTAISPRPTATSVPA